ncbi:hypothetical protein JHFBIEKO_2329 [Methylobacterium mesophilicum]|uniref:Arm DNA-binding domain-containing protein n=1 Tax=Methylobacterium mesophilicum TaxID=39956 RepID=UPI001EE24054|nr:Arm DNA-binding domain-containing protein [Methylobacterium mesophilicum]GJE21880.1 hypothetical protein JHFBIEKO_2329 [Methylobacterium mesophilicum]
MKLTDINASEVSIPEGKSQKLFFDEELAGFGLRVNSGGSRTWFVQYRDKFGRSKRVTIGKIRVLSESEARKTALIVLKRETLDRLGIESLATIRKPALEMDRQPDISREPDAAREYENASPPVTLGDLIEPYLEYWQGQVDPGYLSDIRVYFVSKLASLHQVDINSLDAGGIMECMRGSHRASSRVEMRRALSIFYDWAVKNGFASGNPFKKRKKK